MATYTTELRTLIEQPTQNMENLTLDQKIEVGRVMLFDFDYPMFDERYKRVFETNFIRHFYYREIGFETEHLFKQRLQNWLNLNMGYYSKLFESETLKFDPFINSKVDTTHTKKNDQKSTSDKVFDEDTSRDITESIVTDEDTTKDIDKGVTGSTTYDTDYLADKTIDTNRNTDITGETDGTSAGESDTSESTTQDTSETSDKDTESFSRQLHSDTPDGRLRLTLNEGEGTAEYVSDITENKETGKEGLVTDTTTQTDSNTHTTSSDTTHSETTENENTTENVTENESYDKDESGTSTEDTVIGETGTRDEIVERVLNEIGKRDFDENLVGTKNDLEDYVEHRVGKIGIQTYSKMLQEFRGTFMRIEVDVFREMEGRLFMLVY